MCWTLRRSSARTIETSGSYGKYWRRGSVKLLFDSRCHTGCELHRHTGTEAAVALADLEASSWWYRLVGDADRKLALTQSWPEHQPAAAAHTGTDQTPTLRMKPESPLHLLASGDTGHERGPATRKYPKSTAPVSQWVKFVHASPCERDAGPPQSPSPAGALPQSTSILGPDAVTVTPRPSCRA